jgi:hypothetical protein
MGVQSNADARLGGVTSKGFRPGQSGNPGGRSKGLSRVARELIGDDGRRIVHFWLTVMDDPDCKLSERLEASKLLAERGWGTVPSFALIDEDEPPGKDQAELDAAVAQFSAEVRRLAALQDANIDRSGNGKADQTPSWHG